MNTEKILKQTPHYYDFNTVKDIIVECLKREQILPESDIDEDYCELYFEENFKVYKSKAEFVIEVSLEKLREQINKIFKDIKTTPTDLLEKHIDDYFAIGFSYHGFQDDIATSYMEIETDKGYYVIYTKDLPYWLEDIMSYVDPHLDNYDFIKNELIKRIVL